MVHSAALLVVLSVSSLCLWKRRNRRSNSANIIGLANAACETGDVRHAEVASAGMSNRVFNVPIRLTDIRIVSETDIAYKYVDLVKIPANGNAQHLMVSKTTTKTWSVQGDIDINGCEDRVKVVFHSRDGRHRGHTYIQVDWETKDHETFRFSFEFADESSPNLTLVAKSSTHHKATKAKSDLSLLSQIWATYLEKFKETGDMNALNQAFDHLEHAVKLASDGHPLALTFNNFGLSHSNRFEHAGNFNHLALSLLNQLNQQKEVESPPSYHPALPSRLTNLGNQYTTYFERTGDSKALASAILFHQTAVEMALADHPDFSTMLTNLGSAYLYRTRLTGSLDDLSLAISHLQKTLEAMPDDHPNRPSVLNNLGGGHSIRFERTRDVKDLDSAISTHRKAVKIASAEHPNLFSLLNNLGLAYFDLFKLKKNFDDLTLGTSYLKTAIEATPAGHPELPASLNGLAAMHFEIFMERGNLHDLALAVSNQKETISLSPPSHPDLPGYMLRLGVLLMARSLFTRSQEDVLEAISLFRTGGQSNGAPVKRFKAARQAAEFAFKHDPSNCIDDCSVAMDLLPPLVAFDQILPRRHHHLRDASTFTSFAVALALHFERVDLALKWLEQGRCLVWNQVTQLRSSFDALRHYHPDLADELEEVARALDAAGSRQSSVVLVTTIKDEISLQEAATQHLSLASRYNALLEHIRQKDGFFDFLLPKNVDNLVSSLPPDGPVVVLSAHDIQSDALVFQRGREPILVHLENITVLKAQTMTRQLHQQVREPPQEQEEETDDERGSRPAGKNKQTDLLVLLWEEVVEPIFKALGYLNSPTPLIEDRPRLWWCPTGPFMFLPFHAAHSSPVVWKPTKSVSDFVISSYTPTITTLLTKYNASTASRCTGVAVINQPYAPDLPPIPSTIEEVQALDRLLNNASITHVLLEDRHATISAVIEKMATQSWLHFACHGIQDEKDPLSSGLALQDGLLKLSDIVRERPPHTDFAFLSACQTGKGAADLSDEAVHIAAGMLAIGFNSVIGTMWSISDRHGPKFAEDVYTYLIRDAATTGKLDSSKAAHALDYATRQFRKRFGYGDVSSEWVPYVHFGY